MKHSFSKEDEQMLDFAWGCFFAPILLFVDQTQQDVKAKLVPRFHLTAKVEGPKREADEIN